MNSNVNILFEKETMAKLVQHFGENPVQITKEPIYVNDVKKCDSMVKEMLKEKFVAYDTIMYAGETPWINWKVKYGRKPHNVNERGNFIRIIQLALLSGQTYIVDLFKINSQSSKEFDLPKSLMELLMSQSVTKLVYDIDVEYHAYNRTIHYGLHQFCQSAVDLKPICRSISSYPECNLRFMVSIMFGQKTMTNPSQWYSEHNLNRCQITYAAEDVLCVIYVAKGIHFMINEILGKLDRHFQTVTISNDDQDLARQVAMKKSLHDLMKSQSKLKDQCMHLQTERDTARNECLKLKSEITNYKLILERSDKIKRTAEEKLTGSEQLCNKLKNDLKSAEQIRKDYQIRCLLLQKELQQSNKTRKWCSDCITDITKRNNDLINEYKMFQEKYENEIKILQEKYDTSQNDLFESIWIQHGLETITNNLNNALEAMLQSAFLKSEARIEQSLKNEIKEIKKSQRCTMIWIYLFISLLVVGFLFGCLEKYTKESLPEKSKVQHEYCEENIHQCENKIKKLEELTKDYEDVLRGFETEWETKWLELAQDLENKRNELKSSWENKQQIRRRA